MIKHLIGKKNARVRRATKTRAKIKRLGLPRLCVHRTATHIYAQIIAHDGRVLVSASTLDKTFQEDPKLKTGNIAAASQIGTLIAEIALKVKPKIKKVAFDRSGFKYHGRVKALAEAARKGGLEF